MDKDLPDPILTEQIRHARKAVTVTIGINSGTASVGSTRFEGITGTRRPCTRLVIRVSGRTFQVSDVRKKP